ncbi:hypothetical protein FCU54_25745 [Escherichia coli]|nr:hypothetical protein FCU54_25745 [Escherichia coli]
MLSTTFIIMNSHIEIGKQNKYLNNKHLISMQVVDVESVTSFGERNDSSRQPGGCGLSWSGITVIKKDNVIVFQVVIWPVQLNPVNANPHHKEANFPAML